MRTNHITASEIGDYVYCKRLWWLRLNGLTKSPHDLPGTAAHDRIASALKNLTLAQRIAAIVLLLGISLLILFLLISTLVSSL